MSNTSTSPLKLYSDSPHKTRSAYNKQGVLHSSFSICLTRAFYFYFQNNLKQLVQHTRIPDHLGDEPNIVELSLTSKPLYAVKLFTPLDFSHHFLISVTYFISSNLSQIRPVPSVKRRFWQDDTENW